MGTDSSLALPERRTRTTKSGIDGADESPRVRGVGALPARSALLLLERGPDAGSRFLLDHDTTLIGRSNSDIVLDGVAVSPRHAEIRCHGTSFVIVDVGSFNGTYLNRSPVDTAVLAEGDEIQVGKFRLTFHSALPGAAGEAEMFVATEASAGAPTPGVTEAGNW